MTITTHSSSTTSTKQQNKVEYKLVPPTKKEEVPDEDKLTSSLTAAVSGSVFVVYSGQEKPTLLYDIEKEKEKILRKDIKDILED